MDPNNLDTQNLSEDKKIEMFILLATQQGIPYDQIMKAVNDYEKRKTSTVEQSEKLEEKATEENDRLAAFELANQGDYEAYKNMSASDKIIFKEAGGKVPTENKKTEAEKSQEAKQELATKTINQLAELYYGKPGEKSLALVEAGQFRLPAQLKALEAKIKSGEANSVEERIYTYNRILESKRSSLAKAAGDAGNLALQEQIMAGKGLPGVDATIDEANNLFASGYDFFGGGEPPKHIQQRMQELATVDKNSPQPTQSQTTQQPKINPQGLSNMTVGDIGNSYLGAMKKATPFVANMLTHNPMLGDMLQSDATKTGTGILYPNLTQGLQSVKQGQMPSGENIKGAIPEAALGAAAGVTALKGIPVLSKILRPLNTSKVLRGEGIAEYTKKGVQIGTKEMQEVAKIMLKEKIPTYLEMPLIKKLAEKGALAVDEADQLFKRAGSKTFTKGGDWKTNKVSDYYEVLNRGIREELKVKAPKVSEAITKWAKAQPKATKDKEPIMRLLGKLAMPAAVIGAGAIIGQGLGKIGIGNSGDQ